MLDELVPQYLHWYLAKPSDDTVWNGISACFLWRILL